MKQTIYYGVFRDNKQIVQCESREDAIIQARQYLLKCNSTMEVYKMYKVYKIERPDIVEEYYDNGITYDKGVIDKRHQTVSTICNTIHVS